jgi:hypothetical protein
MIPFRSLSTMSPACPIPGGVNRSDHMMKVLPPLVLASLLSITSAAFADGMPEGKYGKSREEVRAELIRAQHEGQVPAKKTEYPPSAETVARNRELHAIARHAGAPNPPLAPDELAGR